MFQPHSSNPETVKSYYVPMVVEQDGRGERAFDIYSRLLKDRVIFIGSAIDDDVARVKLETLGVKIDTLTEEQIAYMNSWNF